MGEGEKTAAFCLRLDTLLHRIQDDAVVEVQGSIRHCWQPPLDCTLRDYRLFEEAGRRPVTFLSTRWVYALKDPNDRKGTSSNSSWLEAGYFSRSKEPYTAPTAPTFCALKLAVP